jgi:hypothetical protein
MQIIYISFSKELNTKLENKTNKCLWIYMYLLHYNRRKPPIYFGAEKWWSLTTIIMY